jgi:hypothetical protein
MMRSQRENLIWCALGTVGGWLVAAIVYLGLFDWAPPWRYWPYESPFMVLLFVIGMSGVPVTGLWIARGNRRLLTRILVGAGVGALVGYLLQPLYDCSVWQQVQYLVGNPFFKFRGVTCTVVGEGLGSLVAVITDGRSPAVYMLGVILLLCVLILLGVLL